MSASFFDLMKYAKTGIASPEMTGYDKLRAKACFGGYPVTTITGTPPISFKSDGKPLTAWSIAGNMVQTGTPTPDAPITPQECGDRTGNLVTETITNVSGYFRVLFDKKELLSAVETERTLTISFETDVELSSNSVYLVTIDPSYSRIVTVIFGIGTVSATFTLSDDDVAAIQAAQTSRFQVYKSGADFSNSDNAMLETGDITNPYVPYGYKIPLSLSTTPIYLDEPIRRIGDYADEVSSDGAVTRRIRKLVLTGTERWNIYSTAVVQQFYTQDQNIGGLALSSAFSTVAPYGMTANYRTGNFGCYTVTSGTEIAFQMHGARDVFNSQSAWTEYLSAQYAAGTPVTVWYVLATPTTETITAPTLTTAKGSNTLTVGTELQPSAVSVTGNIKAI